MNACTECRAPLPAKTATGRGRARTKYCGDDCMRSANRRETLQRSRYYVLGRYGITEDDYDRMILEQDNRCAICRTDDPLSRSGHWHVDHDHQSDRVRGLLCARCNIGLGQFQDDVERLSAAVEYLSRKAVAA